MEPNEIIKKLKESGYKVYISHLRNFDFNSPDKKPPMLVNKNNVTPDKIKYLNPRGGATIIKVVSGNMEYSSKAKCYVKDNFSKKIGLQVALGRVLKEMDKCQSIF